MGPRARARGRIPRAALDLRRDASRSARSRRSGGSRTSPGPVPDARSRCCTTRRRRRRSCSRRSARVSSVWAPARPPRRLRDQVNRHGGPDAHAPRRHGADDRPRLDLPAPGRARRHPAVRALVQRLRDLEDPRDPGPDVPRRRGAVVRARGREPGQGRLPLRRSACSPTTGPIGTSGCSTSTSSTAARASGSRSARPPTGARAMAPTCSRPCSRSGSPASASSGSSSTATTTTKQRTGSTSASGSSTRASHATRSSARAGYVDLYKMAILADEWRATQEDRPAPVEPR